MRTYRAPRVYAPQRDPRCPLLFRGSRVLSWSSRGSFQAPVPERYLAAKTGERTKRRTVENRSSKREPPKMKPRCNWRVRETALSKASRHEMSRVSGKINFDCARPGPTQLARPRCNYAGPICETLNYFDLGRSIIAYSEFSGISSLNVISRFTNSALMKLRLTRCRKTEGMLKYSKRKVNWDRLI